MGTGHQSYMWSPFFDICMAAGHVLQSSILKIEGKIVHAESSGIIHVWKLLSYFAWPVPVTLLRVYLYRLFNAIFQQNQVLVTFHAKHMHILPICFGPLTNTKMVEADLHLQCMIYTPCIKLKKINFWRCWPKFYKFVHSGMLLFQTEWKTLIDPFQKLKTFGRPH